MRKPEESASSRQMVALRPPPDLRARLEEAAQDAGRPVSKEAEWRLAQSFLPASDPLPGIFSDETRRFLRGKPDVARFLDLQATVFLHVGRAAGERGFSEEETRTALRAAVAFLTGFCLWQGEDVARAQDAPGLRLRDLAPVDLGRKIAEDQMLWLSAFDDEGALFDALEGRIMNAYSGNGRETLSGPTPEEAEAKRNRVRAEAKSRGGGLVDPSELDDFKPVERQDAVPPRPIKDIMGR